MNSHTAIRELINEALTRSLAFCDLDRPNLTEQELFVDDVLADPFAELRTSGLESHVPVMADFWETVLFRAPVRCRFAANQVKEHFHRRVVKSPGGHLGVVVRICSRAP